MNKIYKVVWSRARQCYVVVSEYAKRQTKSAQTKKLLAAFFAAGIALGAGGMSQAAVGNTNYSGHSGNKLYETSTINEVEYTNNYMVLFGGNNSSSGGYSTVFGSRNTTNAEFSMVWGTGNTINNNGARKWQDASISRNLGATVFGRSNTISANGYEETRRSGDGYLTGDFGGYGATVWGTTNEVKGYYSTVWGGQNTVTSTAYQTTTFGVYNVNSGRTTLVGGDNSSAESRTNSAVALGSYVSVLNYGDDETTTRGAFAAGAGTLEKKTTAGGSGAAAIGYSVSAWGTGATAMGKQTSASGTGASALGADTTASGKGAAAIGNGATASGEGASALGFGSIAYGKGAFAAAGGEVGNSKKAYEYGIALGNAASVYAANGVAVGAGANVQQSYGIAIGRNAVSAVANGIALGDGSTAVTVSGQVGYLASEQSADDRKTGVWKSTNAGFSIGSASTVTRQISGLAAGTVDTDAVNVAQLRAVNNKTIVDAKFKNGLFTLEQEGGATITVAGFSNTIAYQANAGNKKTVTMTEGLHFLNGTYTTVTAGDSGTVQVDINETKIKELAKSTVDVEGSENISVSESDGTFTVSLKNNITLGEGENAVNIDGTKGEIVIGTSGTPVKISKSGISAGDKRITNVAAGSADTDAVNVGQLNTRIDEAKEAAAAADIHVKSGSYEVTSSTAAGKKTNSAVLQLVSNKNGTETSEGTVVITGMATAYDVGDVDALPSGVKNSDGSHTSVVEAITNLDNTVKKVDGKHTTVTTDDNLTLDVTAATDEKGANYKIGLGKKLTVGDEEGNPVTVDGVKGTVTGLTNTKWNPDAVVADRAATEGQLSQAIAKSGEALTAKGFGLSDGTKSVTKSLGEAIEVKGANGVTTEVKGEEDAKYLEVSLGNDLVIGGKDGADGSITIKHDNTQTTITVGKNGKDGITRIIYEDKTVATLDDGMIFAGDAGDENKLKLNSKLTISGGESDAEKLTTAADKNIGVISDGEGKLEVRLAKKVTGLESVTAENMYVTNVDNSDNSVTNKKYVDEKIVQSVAESEWTLTTNGGTGHTSNTGKGIRQGSTVDFAGINGVVVSKEDSEKGTAVKVGLGDQITVGEVVIGAVSAKNADGQTVTNNYVTGLTNTKWDPDAVVADRAATEGQLSQAIAKSGEALTAKGFGLSDGTKSVTKSLGEAIEVKGANGVTTEVKGEEDAKYLEVSLGNDLVIGGKDGADGSITIKHDNTQTTITVGKNGKDGVDGTNGKDGITRIIYEDKTVATLDDGMIFAGDAGDENKLKLNSKLTISGGESDAEKLTTAADKNIGVISDGEGKLEVRLAKKVTGLESVTAENMYVTNVDNSDNSVTNKKYVDEKIVQSVAESEWTLTTNGGTGHTSNTGKGIRQGSTVDFAGINGVVVSKEDSEKGTAVKVGLGDQITVGEVVIGAVSAKNADGQTVTNNYVTGLTNTKWDPSAVDADRAATEGQLKEVSDSLNTKVADAEYGFATDDGKTIAKKVNTNMTVKGENGIRTAVKGEGDDAYLAVELGSKLTVGKDGKDGEDGSITIVKQDGTKGEITVVEGKPGVDGKDGETLTRIEYKDKNGDTHDVATLEDGLKFGGDSGDVIVKKLNEQIDIVGGAKAELTEGNIGVVSENGKLNVKLSSEVTGLTKVESTNMYVTNVDNSDNSVTNKKYVDEKITQTVADSAWQLTTNGGKEEADKAVDVKQNTVVDFTGENGVKISKDGTNVKFGLGDTIQVGGEEGITIGKQSPALSDGHSAAPGNYITGLDNTKWDPAAIAADRAATEGQLKDIDDKITQTVAEGMTFAAGDGTNVKKALGETVTIKGDDANISTTVKDGSLVISLAKDITGDSFTAGGTVVNGDGLTVAATAGKDGKDAITIKQNDVSYGGNVIHHVGDGTAADDAATVGQLNKAVESAKNADKHIRTGEYTVGGQGVENGVAIDVISKDENGNEKVEGQVTIKDMAKASDVGSLSDLNDQLRNYEKNADGTPKLDDNGQKIYSKTTVIDAVNNLNEKVGDQKYSEVTGTKIEDGDSATTAIGKLDNRMDEMDKTLDNVSKSHTEVTAGNGISVKDNGDDAKHKYEISLTPEITLGEAADAEAGKEGTDGKLTVTGKDGKAVTVDGASGTISGLTNTDWDAKDTDKYKGSTKAATESQLQQAMSGAIQYDRKDDGSVDTTKVTLAENDGAGTTITNVANGKIAKGSQDAVNGGQLYDVQQSVNNNTQNIQNLGSSVNKLATRVNRVGANAAALAALHPLDFDPDAKWDFAAGYGNYHGANAVAVGAYYRPNEDLMFSLGGSFGGGENMVNAGVSVKLGSGSSHVSTSKTAMAKEIKEMRSIVAEQDAQIAKLTEIVNALVGVGHALPYSPDRMFPDVPENHWAYEAVDDLIARGLVEGYPDGTFGGDRTLTRYEFAMIVHRALQKGAEVSERLQQEFAGELKYFTVDVVERDADGAASIQRVRAVRERVDDEVR